MADRERDRDRDEPAADAPARDEPAGDEFKTFVGGISWHMKDRELKETFVKYNAKDAVVMLDKVTGRSRGFGFVMYSNKADMEEAITNMHNKEVDGRRISVTRAIPQSETVPGTPAHALGLGGGRAGGPRDRERAGSRYDRPYERGYDRGGYGSRGYERAPYGYERGPGYERAPGGYDRGYDRPGYEYDRAYERGYGAPPGYGAAEYGYGREAYPRDAYAGGDRYAGGYEGYERGGGYGGGYERAPAAYPDPAYERGYDRYAAPERGAGGGYRAPVDDRYAGGRDYGRYAGSARPGPYDRAPAAGGPRPDKP